jgi:hypothetical protein
MKMRTALKFRRMHTLIKLFVPAAICEARRKNSYLKKNSFIDKDECNSWSYPFDPHRYKM